MTGKLLIMNPKISLLYFDFMKSKIKRYRLVVISQFSMTDLPKHKYAFIIVFTDLGIV